MTRPTVITVAHLDPQVLRERFDGYEIGWKLRPDPADRYDWICEWSDGMETKVRVA